MLQLLSPSQQARCVGETGTGARNGALAVRREGRTYPGDNVGRGRNADEFGFTVGRRSETSASIAGGLPRQH